MTQIALFGTSADPPTAGHQTILSWLSKHYDLVIVWASDNPFKQHQTSLENRSRMLGLAIAEIGAASNNINLCPELSDRRSLLTIQKARKIWPDAEFTFVIGSDLVSQISSWYQVAKLLSLVKILIVPRPGYSISQSDLDTLKQLGGNYSLAALNAPEASSTAYRMQGDHAVLTPAVAAYIAQQKLYRKNPELANQNLEATIC